MIRGRPFRPEPPSPLMPRVLDFLAAQDEPVTLSQIAAALDVSHGQILRCSRRTTTIDLVRYPDSRLVPGRMVRVGEMAHGRRRPTGLWCAS